MEYYADNRQRSYQNQPEDGLDDGLDRAGKYVRQKRRALYTRKYRQKLTYTAMLSSVIDAFMEGWYSQNPDHWKEKELREHLTEKQIDKMVEDSFPSSDPPSTY